MSCPDICSLKMGLPPLYHHLHTHLFLRRRTSWLIVQRSWQCKRLWSSCASSNFSIRASTTLLICFSEGTSSPLLSLLLLLEAPCVWVASVCCCCRCCWGGCWGWCSVSMGVGALSVPMMLLMLKQERPRNQLCLDQMHRQKRLD